MGPLFCQLQVRPLEVCVQSPLPINNSGPGTKPCCAPPNPHPCRGLMVSELYEAFLYFHIGCEMQLLNWTITQLFVNIVMFFCTIMAYNVIIHIIHLFV